MNREEVTLLGFEIVAFSGDARSKMLDALKWAQNGDYARAEELIAEAETCLNDAIKRRHPCCRRNPWVKISPTASP